MRTTIEIDGALMQNALKITGLKTQQEAVELGLQTLIRLGGQSKLRSLRGTVKWEGDLNALRTDA